MERWFNDNEVNELLTKLLDALCTAERMGGEAFSSTLIFFAHDKEYPVLFAMGGKPFYPREPLSLFDLEIAVKGGLKDRLPH